MNRRQFGLVGTILVHLLVLWVILPHNKREPPPTEPPMTMVLAFTSVDIQDAMFNDLGEPCSNSHDTYIGIGIIYEFLTLTITKAPEAPTCLPGWHQSG